MTGRKISQLVSGFQSIATRGPGETEITSIEFDSRLVKMGSLFAALPGAHADGNAFIESAISRGARAILSEKSPAKYNDKIYYIIVKNARAALSAISSAFYGHPSRRLKMIGVTGTDGKSTTVWLIHKLIEGLGKKSGFVSTVELGIPGKIEKNPYRQSTPEAPLIHSILDAIAREGAETAVIEATSHGLSLQTCRLKDVLFDIAVLTNITHEHLEFHGSFEQYRSDKAELFRSISHGKSKKTSEDENAHVSPLGVVNLNDPSARYIIGQTAAAIKTYGIDNREADLSASNIELSASGASFRLNHMGKKIEAVSPLQGSFNVENLMAACLAVLGIYPVELEELAGLFPSLSGVRGRMTEIACGQSFRVIVDYAHTPEAFEKVFSMLRPRVHGRLISVFGSAGERDLAKRPMQGKIASEYCDIIVLTDEDPRLENREKILAEILAGCKDLAEGMDVFLEPDRRKAIEFAFSLAKGKDTVILLGKGHESSIIYPEGAIPWDEIEVAKSILRDMGF